MLLVIYEWFSWLPCGPRPSVLAALLVAELVVAAPDGGDRGHS